MTAVCSIDEGKELEQMDGYEKHVRASKDSGRISRADRTSNASRVLLKMKAITLILAAARQANPPAGSPRFLLNWIRFVYTGLTHINQIEVWLAAPDAERGGLLASLRERPRMLGVIEWPYLNKDWDVARRFASIRNHYLALAPFKWLRFGVRESRVLADLDDIMPGLALKLDRPEWFIREGELTLNLFVGETRLYSLVFLLGNEDGQLIAYIGAVQGRDIDGIDAIYRDMTKRLHGARPRDFLISVFQSLCSVIGVKRILAVSDECRHHRHPYFRAKSPKGANYDGIWEDRGGVRVAAGFFELPAQHVPRAETEIAPNKRSMYRKRYALIERIRLEMARQSEAAADKPAVTD
jgi:uncharacterized protein VirK/YbjX